MNKYLYILYSIWLVVLTSCSERDVPTDTVQADAEPKVVVSCMMGKMAHTDVSTSLSRAMSETAIADLYVLIFDSNGYLIGRQYTAGTDVTSVTVGNARVASNCTVYAFANTHSATYFNGVTSTALLTTFLSNHYQTITNAAALGAQDNLWMMGKKTGVNITSGTTTVVDLTLYRYNAKIGLNVSCATNINVTAYQLCHVPLKSAITEATPIANVGDVTYADFDKVTLATETGTLSNVVYYMLPNYAGRGANSTSFDKRFSKYAPADASYIRLWIHGNGWNSIVDVYLGGDNATDFTNYNVNRNTFYNYSINVNGPGLGNMNVTFDDRPNIGDYYYSDGTWGPLGMNSGKTPIAVVFSNTPTAKNRLHNWTHGMALALKNATTSPVSWSANSTEFYDGFDSTNNDGYTLTHWIKANKGVSTTSFPAFYYALNYSVPAPTIGNNSGWYLPSWGEWFDVMFTLGGATQGRYTSTGAIVSVNKEFTGTGKIGTVWFMSNWPPLTKLNNYFTNAGGSILFQSSLSVANSCWGSSLGYVSSANAYWANALFTNGGTPDGFAATRSETYHVRSAIAF